MEDSGSIQKELETEKNQAITPPTPESIEVNLLEKCSKCEELIRRFYQVKKQYFDALTQKDEPTAKVCAEVLLGLATEIGEQVNYIKGYQQAQNQSGNRRGPLDDFAFWIPEIRNLLYHNLIDTVEQRSKFKDQFNNFASSLQEMSQFIFEKNKKFDLLLDSAEQYIRGIHAQYKKNNVGKLLENCLDCRKLIKEFNNDMKTLKIIVESLNKKDEQYKEADQNEIMKELGKKLFNIYSTLLNINKTISSNSEAQLQFLPMLENKMLSDMLDIKVPNDQKLQHLKVITNQLSVSLQSLDQILMYYEKPIFAPPLIPKGLENRLQMAIESVGKIKELMNLKDQGKVSEEDFKYALKFHFARMCVGYEEFLKEIEILNKHGIETPFHNEVLQKFEDIAPFLQKIHDYKLVLAHGANWIGIDIDQALKNLLPNLEAFDACFLKLAQNILPELKAKEPFAHMLEAHAQITEQLEKLAVDNRFADKTLEQVSEKLDSLDKAIKSLEANRPKDISEESVLELKIRQLELKLKLDAKVKEKREFDAQQSLSQTSPSYNFSSGPSGSGRGYSNPSQRGRGYSNPSQRGRGYSAPSPRGGYIPSFSNFPQRGRGGTSIVNPSIPPSSGRGQNLSLNNPPQSGQQSGVSQEPPQKRNKIEKP